MSSHKTLRPAGGKNAASSGNDKSRLTSLALGVVAAMLAAAGFCGAASAETKPGQLECFKLRENCLAHAQKLSAATTVAASSVNAAGSEKLTAETCQKLYLDAKDTGVWPAYKGFPAVKCVK